MDTAAIALDDSTQNARLFECTVGPYVPEPSSISGASGSSAERLAKKRSRERVADALLTAGLDVGHTNDVGENLLMITIASYLTDIWKERTVARLIDQGVDPSHTNREGDTVQDYAERRGTETIRHLVARPE